MDDHAAKQTQATQVHDDNMGSESDEEQQPKAMPWGRLFSISAEHQSIELTGADPFVLGRHASCRFTFDDPVISNRHCSVIREKTSSSYGDYNDFTVFVEDLSTNGTFVNDEKIGKGKRISINHGDKIALSLKKKTAPSFLFHDCLRKPDFTQAKTELHSQYNIIRPLGSGACGEVWLASSKQTGLKYAAKVIQKKRFNSSGVVGLWVFRLAIEDVRRCIPHVSQNPAPTTRELIQEVNILQKLNHPNVIAVHEMFDTEEALYIVLELASGGELFDRIIDKRKFSEPETKFFFRQLFLAVKYLHENGVVHRDLKPENILLANGTMDAVVKVTDFGLAKLVGPHSFMKTMCGTPDYLAPEVLKTGMMKSAGGMEGYSSAVDMWSLGVILYICLSGTPPFSSEITYHGKSLAEQILGAIYTFPNEEWRGVSDSAKDLIRKLLVVDPSHRLSVDGCLTHPWMQDAEIIAKVDRIIAQHAIDTRRDFPELGIKSSGSPLLHSGATNLLDNVSIDDDSSFKNKRKKIDQ